MKPTRKWCAVGKFFSILIFLWACSDKPWPERGKAEIVERLSHGTRAIRSYKSTWMKESGNDFYPVFEEGHHCIFDLTKIHWTVFDNVVNGTVRCTIDGITAEYTVQSFRKQDTIYGSYTSTYAHFPAMEEHPVGSVTNIMKTPY